MFSTCDFPQISNPITKLLKKMCCPTTQTDNSDSPVNTEVIHHPIDPAHIPNTDFPEHEPKALRAIRNEGYAVVFAFFNEIKKVNETLINAQWRQFERELSKLDHGEHASIMRHMSPNDIVLCGEAYGSLPDQLMSFMAIINAPNSPFHCTLPRLPKANDTIPIPIQDRLQQHPRIQCNIYTLFNKAEIERALDVLLTKKGAENPLTVASINSLIQALEQRYPTAREYDEASPYHHNSHDRALFQLESLQAKLLVIRDKLVKHYHLCSEDNMDIIAWGGKV